MCSSLTWSRSKTCPGAWPPPHAGGVKPLPPDLLAGRRENSALTARLPRGRSYPLTTGMKIMDDEAEVRAHWQVGLAYAADLCPELRAHIHEVYRRAVEKGTATAVPGGTVRAGTTLDQIVEQIHRLLAAQAQAASRIPIIRLPNRDPN